MCPLCASTLTWLALGGGSASTLAALLVGFRRKGTEDGDDRGGPSDGAPDRDS
jgi:hypothetical protein